MSWKGTIIDWFDIFGPGALAMLSFTEAIIQPVPPDLLYLPMLLDNMNSPSAMLWLWLVVTISSVAGSFIGYYLGKKFGIQFIEYFGYERHLTTLESLTEKYGSIGVFVAAFSPLPYKVFGWVAGMGSMNKKLFILAGLFGRALRFGVEALLIWYYGESILDGIMWFLDNEILLAVITLLTIAAVCYFYFRSQRKSAPLTPEE